MATFQELSDQLNAAAARLDAERSALDEQKWAVEDNSRQIRRAQNESGDRDTAPAIVAHLDSASRWLADACGSLDVAQEKIRQYLTALTAPR